MVIFYAALVSLDVCIYEAAKLRDGASSNAKYYLRLKCH